MKGLALDNGCVAAGAFDFDGNILLMQTPHFYVDRETGEVVEVPGWKVDQNPEIYFGEERKYDLIDDNKEKTFGNYRCIGGYSSRGFSGLYDDVRKAIEDGKLSPSFKSFKEIFL